jgi:hypothetical protein
MSSMDPQKPTPAERQHLRERAQAIYEMVRGDLEATCKGKIVAIEADSGEYFVGDTLLEAARQARTKYREKPCHFIRIGFPTVYVRR